MIAWKAFPQQKPRRDCICLIHTKAMPFGGGQARYDLVRWKASGFDADWLEESDILGYVEIDAKSEKVKRISTNLQTSFARASQLSFDFG